MTDALGPGHAADRGHLGDGRASTTTSSDEVGDSAPMLIVLGSLLIGGIAGSLLRLEQRVEALGRLAAAAGWPANPGRRERHRFIEGFVVSSLVFCTGPLTILGSLNDGLGNGADQLLPQGGAGRVRRDRVRGVVRLGRGRQRPHHRWWSRAA